MKKDKKIKELDDWLENSNDEDFEDHDVSTLNCLLYTSDAADE